MKWSLTICTLFGIRIRVHVTFLLLLFLVVAIGMESGWRVAAWCAALLAGTFACVALHELGHSLAAQRLGVRVSAITLLPIGGVAQMRSMPQKPSYEVAITVAGPLTNALIFGVLYLIGDWAPFLVPYYAGLPLHVPMPVSVGDLIGSLLLVNKWMIAFNLVPAYPMDGGRLLRALLAGWLGFPRATVVAARIGRAMAMLFIVAGLFAELYMLPFVGLVIFMAAGMEERAVLMQSVLRGVDVASVMNPACLAVAPEDTASQCLAMLHQAGQDDFPVVADGHVIGLLTREAILEDMRETGGGACASDLMIREFRCAWPEAPAAEVHEEMQSSGQRTVPVLRDGRLAGVLTQENINRYFLVRSFLNGRKGAKSRAYRDSRQR
ncbi:MAG: M50 family metallopeptidase [Verrucomicrobiae bacterium]|nr:M50 family metallopeptidase [Verrucomicrobiae bacterium]